ncbi:MAG: acyltransferase, partial [Flavobacterium sp.]
MRNLYFVIIFFVISGFLINYLLLIEEKSNNNIKIGAFYIRRALRVLPVFLVYFAFILLQPFEPNDLTLKNILHIITFTVNFDDSRVWSTGHFWSLGIEEQFYITWPLLFIAYKKRRKQVLIILIGCSCIIRALHYKYQTPIYDLHHFFTFSDAIMIGSLGAIFYFENPKLIDFQIFRRPVMQLISLSTIVAILYFSSNLMMAVLTVPFKNLIISLCILHVILSNIKPSDSFSRTLHHFA